MGLLFDHGCDAFTAGFMTMISAKFIQGGDGYLTWWVSVGANLTFHINTLEEYYCGGLFLTTGNGVTDGSFGLYTLMIIMSILGDHWCT